MIEQQTRRSVKTRELISSRYVKQSSPFSNRKLLPHPQSLACTKSQPKTLRASDTTESSKTFTVLFFKSGNRNLPNLKLTQNVPQPAFEILNAPISGCTKIPSRSSTEQSSPNLGR